MDKFGVTLALEAVAEARNKWRVARMDFDSEVQRTMTRLLREAAVNGMSVEQVAKYSDTSPAKIRYWMRRIGLEPRQGKRLLSKIAAEALAENATLLGIEPHEMDLASPLAYLPMGAELRAALTAAGPRPSGPEIEHRAHCAAQTCCLDAVSR